MGFIEFPFIEVTKDLRKIVGEPTPGTRAYRREGTHAECGQWIEDLGLHYKGDVGISPAGVTMFVPVQRAAVHKRIKEGKLTAFFFYITRIEDTFFGNKRKVKLRPYILLSMSECKAWVVEMKRRIGYVDEPDESLIKQRKKLKLAALADEPKTRKEVEEALAFADTDPKDKGNRKVRYEEPLSTENRQQDMFLLLAEAMAAMASDKKKAEFYQKRLERGMQNHDQVGNRAGGERSGQLMSLGKLKIGAALVLTSPFVPMLFQGEEWGASTPFFYFTDYQEPELANAVREGRCKEFAAFGWKPEDTANPQARETFEKSKLNWPEILRVPHAEILEWHKKLIRLRRSEPDLNDGEMESVRTRFDEEKRWLVVERGGVVVGCNFSDKSQTVFFGEGTFHVLLLSEKNVEISGGKVKLPPDSIAILKRK